MRQTLANLYSAERHRLPLWMPVGLGLGIALYFAQNSPEALWMCVSALFGSIALAMLAWKHAIFRILALLVFALSLGASASAIRLQMVEAPVLREPVFFKMVEGTVEDIQLKEKKVKLVLAHSTIETLGSEVTPLRISVTLKKLEADIAIGDKVRLPATLFTPPGPAMPGAYDFARMFYFDQLGAVGFSPRQPEVISKIERNTWQDKLTALRLSIADHLMSAMGTDMGAVASALMVGEQSRVPEEISDSMRASGIYHILSISGLHMSLATGLIFFVARLLLAAIPHAAHHWPNKKIAAICGLIGGFAYLLLAGSPVPAVRSYIMVSCVLVAILCDRKGISMFSLGWAATLILLIMPESIFTASFQLSFAATLAIVALYERSGARLFHANAGIIGKFFLYFLGLMVTSLAVTFYTSPLAIIHFNRMAIYGIVANMLIVPLSSFWIMPMAMLVFITMPLGLDAWPMELLKMGLEWMMRASYFFSNLPYANITLPSPNGWGIALIVAGGLWLALWVTRLRYAGLVMMLAGLTTMAMFTPYDLIISDDAKRIAYRSTSGEWAMIRGKVDSFESEIWLRMQGDDAMLSRKETKLAELTCGKEICTINRDKHHIAIALKKIFPDDLCVSGADIAITAQYLSCAQVPHIIDRAYVEQHGAVAIRLKNEGLTIDTTQQGRGDWPWAKAMLAPDEDDAMMPQIPTTSKTYDRYDPAASEASQSSSVP